MNTGQGDITNTFSYSNIKIADGTWEPWPGRERISMMGKGGREKGRKAADGSRSVRMIRVVQSRVDVSSRNKAILGMVGAHVVVTS